MHRSVVSLLALVASAPLVLAQEALFLDPADSSVALGAQVEFSAVVGEEVAPWPADRIGHFFARTAWTQENRDTLGADADAGPVATWTADLPGVLMLGCDLAPRVELVPAAAFAAFVERVLPESRRADVGAIADEGEVEIRRVESAKTLVRVEAAGQDPVSIATSKSGQAVEIRPLMDPTSVVLGSDLAVRIYASIPGSAGGVVLATNSSTGEVVRATTNDSSVANITVSSPGRWRLEFHAVTAVDEGDVRWLVHTATLTFDVTGGGGGDREGEVTK